MKKVLLSHSLVTLSMMASQPSQYFREVTLAGGEPKGLIPTDRELPSPKKKSNMKKAKAKKHNKKNRGW